MQSKTPGSARPRVQGEPRLGRTMALLWSSHDRKVGRTGLTIEDFITAAVEMVREQGADGLSMRNLATRLKVRPMAIYAHIPGKDDLVALMVDRAYRGLYQNAKGHSRNDWSTRLRAVAMANRALYLENSWLHHLKPVRSPMGPHEFDKHEFELATIDGIGLTDVEMDQTLSLVLAHVAQAARLEEQLRHEQRESGLDDRQWWVEATPALERLVDLDRHPLSARVGSAATLARHGEFRGRDAFEFGLERILDGLSALIERRRRP